MKRREFIKVFSLTRCWCDSFASAIPWRLHIASITRHGRRYQYPNRLRYVLLEMCR